MRNELSESSRSFFSSDIEERAEPALSLAECVPLISGMTPRSPRRGTGLGLARRPQNNEIQRPNPLCFPDGPEYSIQSPRALNSTGLTGRVSERSGATWNTTIHRKRPTIQYEEQVKRTKEQKARASVPKF
jgi:hypothetical protein